VPILTLTGVQDTKFKLQLGAATAVALPPDATLAYTEHTGAAIESGSNELKDLEERMRQAGAELLVLASRITATQIHSENAVGKSVLHEIAGGLEDGLNKALQVMLQWSKTTGEVQVKLFDDYGAATLSDASAQLIAALQLQGLIQKTTAINELKRRGVLSDQVDADEELSAVAEEGPALGTMTDQGAGNGQGA
jgi:hypothetical protein